MWRVGKGGGGGGGGEREKQERSEEVTERAREGRGTEGRKQVETGKSKWQGQRKTRR